MTFDDLLNKVKKEPITITVKDKPRKTVFAASYCTKHYPDAEYLKIFFDDGTILKTYPEDERLYFCDDKRRTIDRGLFSDYGDYLNIDGEEYLLNDGGDEQVLKKTYYGNIDDGEDGHIFKTYVSVNGIWTLTTLDDGSISGMHEREISLKDIKID